jgi:hypothetical protein
MNTQKQSPPPFCVDCNNFIPADIGVDGDAPRCKLFPMTDVVMGNPFYVACHAIRSEGAPCGTKAELFVPKDDLDKAKVMGLDPAHDGAEKTFGDADGLRLN